MAASINQLVQRWKKIDFTRLQLALDEAASDLASRQDDSETSRKKLVELSRDFKKNVSDEIRQIVAPLLKSFQNEVDSLSKRSKASEAAFLTVYKKIIDVPDPVSSLELCQQRAHRTQELEIENDKLQETLKEFGEEIRDLKNQETTVKQLRGKLKEYEAGLELAIQERLSHKECQWKQAEGEHLANLTSKLEEAEKKIVQLQSALENSQSELLELRSRYDEVTHTKFEELEMMMNDLERANQRTVLAEKEMGQLKEKLDATQQSFQMVDQNEKSPRELEQTVQVMTRSSLELELHSKEKQISHLMDDIQRLQSTLTTLKESSASKIAQLEDLLLEKEKLISELEEKLSHQKDYEEIKKELSIFKSMEFSGNSSTVKQPLEVMLLEKNKALQSENTSLKVSKSELSGKLEQERQEKLQLIKLNDEQKTILEQLEADLTKVDANYWLYHGDGEGQETESLPPNIVAEADKSNSYSQQESAGQQSLLPIISSQRERFRQRNHQLEMDNEVLHKRLSQLDNDLNVSRADNVKLYEKIKFLQSYNRNQSQSSHHGDIEQNYSEQYEKKLDPFKYFSKTEKHRKYMSLSPFEKITYTMGRTILSSRVARTIVFFYTLFLHCLVFLVLFKLANSEVCQKDLLIECNQRYMAHMRDVHEDKN